MTCYASVMRGWAYSARLAPQWRLRRKAARLGIQLRDKHGTAAGPTACAIAIPTQPSSGQERRGEKHSVVALRHQTFLWRAFFTSAKVSHLVLSDSDFWQSGIHQTAGTQFTLASKMQWRTRKGAVRGAVGPEV